MAQLESAQNTELSNWGNPERIQAIQFALGMVPHNQTAIGLGFKLSHSPTNCLRCRAEISLLEIGGILGGRMRPEFDELKEARNDD